MKSRMQHQGGWAATFVVVGVVLALGLIGGIYYLKTHSDGDVATTDEGASTSEIEKTLDSATNDDNTSSDDSNSGTTDDATDKTPPADTDKTTTTESPTPAPSPESTTEHTPLPETGPSDVMAQLIAVVALTVSSVAYIRSR